MAFAKQYFSSYKSNNNLDYYLEIWVDGFDSSATEISVGAGGPVISYETDQEDRFSPIISSQCVLPFVVKDISTQAFIQQLRTTYKERQVYLHLYRATSSTYTTTKPIWSGFLVMDLGSGEDVSFPYEQKLTFVDGLSLLKDIDFVDLSNAGSETNIQGSYTQDNMYYGPGLYTFWIKEILAKAGVATTTKGVSIDYGFTTAVNWYNADMQNTNQGSDPLGLTKCVVSMFHTKNDQDVFTPENCYTVLKELLRHWGARITYWKHEFWIVQIPEYITDENGLIDNPDNINSRQYNRFGTLTGSQDHLGDTYYTRYEQTIQSNQVSKLVGTKYNYLPMIHNADADFLSFASKNYYGGFPYGANAESQEIFQGTIIDPSTADFLWLSIPLDWKWDMSGSSLTNGHVGGWWCSVKFNFYASDGTTTYYLQYDSSGQGSYYWVLEADWTPLGNTSPKYVIKSRSLTETNYIGFQQDIPFVDSAGSAITMTGAWSFFLDIEDFANQSSSGPNPGSFFCRFSGYAPSSHYSYVKHDPYQEFPKLPTTGNVSGSGPETKSGKVSWSNTLENPATVFTSVNLNPAGFNAGTSQADIQLMTSSDFKGLLQTLNTTQSASFGSSINTQVNNSTNTERFSFGTLLWGDAIDQFAVSCLRVNNGTAFEKTNPIGEWGRGTLTGTNTFTELLINEFLSGQIKVVIAPTMRLAVGEANKNQTATGTGGPATRPRYVNPIGRLRESRTNETDPEYIFRRGSFHSLYDEWDYEGYQILRDTVSATTTTNDIGGLGGAQDNGPISDAKIIPNVTNALMMNSPVAYIRTTVPATGSNVAVNGNFNTAVGWTLGTGWSIDTTAKKAKFAATGSTSELTQSVLTQGLTYQVNFQVVVTAGTLLVKAGTSGTSQSITTSGDYSFYLDCDGSNLIKFQAGTTFTGNITYITLRDQKSISAVPINSIGSTVFKSGDTFNLINSLGGEILPLTVSSNQGATDDTISVTSTALFDDIGIDSVLLINQDDLSAQYQNKTKGTVAGFGIDADGISKGGIEITDWLNSDTMTGAAVTNVPTALSVKNYVDAQVGSADTLQEVTDNGNTTTNSITFAGGTSTAITTIETVTDEKLVLRVPSGDSNDWNYIAFKGSNGVRDAFIGTDGDGDVRIFSDKNNGKIDLQSGKTVFDLAGSEKMRLTSGGNLLIGTTTDGGAGNGNKRLQVVSPNSKISATFGKANGATGDYTGIGLVASGNEVKAGLFFEDTASFNRGSLHFANRIALDNDVDMTLADSKMSITSAGNVLIGTTTDNGYKLQVNGSATFGAFVFAERFRTTVAGTASFAAIYMNSDSNTGLFQPSSDNIGFTTAGSERMRLNADGLGIGTSSPVSKINIATTKTVALDTTAKFLTLGLTIDDLNAGNTAGGGGGIAFRSKNTNSGTQMVFGAIDAVKEFATVSEFRGSLRFFTNQNSTGVPLERMRINSAGAIAFNGAANYGSSGQVLKSNGNASPTWVDASSVIGGPYLPLAGGTLTGGLTGTTANFSTSVRTGYPSGRFYALAGGSFYGEIIPFNINGQMVINVNYPNGQLLFKDEGSEYARFNNGNLLLGTTTDSGEKLVVNGNAKYSGKILAGVGATAAATINAYTTTVSTNLFSALRILENTGASSYWDIGATGGTSTLLNFYHNANTTAKISFTHLGGATFSGQVTIPATPVASTDAASKSYVDAQVGSADTLQEVTDNGNSSSNSIKITGGATEGGNSVQLVYDANYAQLQLKGSTGSFVNFSDGSTDFKGRIQYINSDNSMKFVTNTSEKMRLTSTGDLGIGTTSPLAKMHIREANAGSFTYDGNADTLIVESNANGGITVATAAANSGYIIFASPNDATSAEIKYDNSTNLMYVGTTYGGGGSLILQAGSGVEAMRILANGNTLIATTTDNGEKLQVNGTAKIDGNVSIGGSVGAVYKLDVVGKARVQSVFELDDVLTLNQISTPADPQSGQSSIYMDSADGAIKVKINVGGTVVTRTIASFE